MIVTVKDRPIFEGKGISISSAVTCDWVNHMGWTGRRKRKQHHRCETYRFLLIILNTSFCSSCTKRKNSLIWALIDISSILIRSTLAGYYTFFFFCSFVMMWLTVTEINLIVSIQKRKVKIPSPHTPPVILNIYTTCTSVSLGFLFLCGVKIGRLSQRTGGCEKRREWLRILHKIIMNIVMFTIDAFRYVTCLFSLFITLLI